MKGRTSQEPTDPVEGKRPEEASRRGNASTRHGGKHGEVQEDPWMERVLDRENLAAAWKRVSEVVTELKHYVVGWMNYFGISHTYKEVIELDQ